MLNKLKIISILLACLVATMPIAFATKLNIVQYSGNEGVDGFHGAVDNVNIKVQGESYGEKC